MGGQLSQCSVQMPQSCRGGRDIEGCQLSTLPRLATRESPRAVLVTPKYRQSPRLYMRPFDILGNHGLHKGVLAFAVASMVITIAVAAALVG